MKILIAYYSKTGNTKKVAADLAARLGADTEEILDKKKRHGFFNWFRAGRDGMKKVGTEIGELTKDPAEYDAVIVGSPVWAWNIAPAARTFLEKNKDKIRKYAFFVTSGNTPSEKMLPHLKEIMDREPSAHVGFSAGELKDQEVYEKKISDFVTVIKNQNQ